MGIFTQRKDIDYKWYNKTFPMKNLHSFCTFFLKNVFDFI